MPSGIPLVVDLDGTLHPQDVSWMEFRRALGRSPLAVLSMAPMGVLSRTRQHLKQRVSACANLDVRSLCYDARVLDLIEAARNEGRMTVLATGAAQSTADRVAQHLGSFSLVLASTSAVNLVARNKAQALVDRFGSGGFDYAGNSRADLEVWPHCRRAIVVNASPAVLASARTMAEVALVLPAVALHGARHKPGGWL